jgi:hypothetical protein
MKPSEYRIMKYGSRFYAASVLEKSGILSATFLCIAALKNYGRRLPTRTFYVYYQSLQVCINAQC